MPAVSRYSFMHALYSVRAGGWSINFWNSNTTGLAGADYVTLKTALLKVEGRQTIIPHVRWSLVEGPTPLSDGADFPGFSNQNVDIGDNSDYGTTSLLIKLRAQERSAQTWIRGIPDLVCTKGGEYGPGNTIEGDYATRVGALFTVLESSSNGWSIRVRDKTITKKNVNTITSAGEVTVNAHGYAQGDVVTISGVTFPDKYPNGRWKIQAVVDANSFHLARWNPPLLSPGPWPLQGTCQKYVFLVKQITRCEVVRISKRDIGRPFGLLIGRHKRRR